MSLRWIDASDVGIGGKGWVDTRHLYDRLPLEAEGQVPEVVWRLSRQAAGLYVNFRTDATEIHARTVLRKPGRPQFHYRKYLDLYARDDTETWRWAGVSKFGYVPSGETPLLEGATKKSRTYRLYLPTFFEVDRLSIGVPEDAQFDGLAPQKDPLIAYYGTSVVHATHALRPGLPFPAILQRRLGGPVLNLGFSGSACMERELAEVFTDLDPELFVVDTLPNMGADLVRERAERFLRILIEAHPEMPILMVEDRVHTNQWIKKGMAQNRSRCREAYRDVYEKLSDEGCNIAYHSGDDLLGDDGEGTIDGSHPASLGLVRVADNLEPVIRQELSR